MGKGELRVAEKNQTKKETPPQIPVEQKKQV